ncbi:MAG: Purine nucleoside phosphorylase 1 [Gemmatimonadaceae bacterium]|nr:Purine nucleoside phosphorylase 1 [Gemmatimonadaceae bacterium]
MNAAAVAVTLRERLEATPPDLAIVLGSGLGGLADRIERLGTVPYRDIEGFAVPAVDGHAGELISGRLGGRPVLALAGRFHMYEGHSAERAGFPVSLVHALGARVLLLSNAAGGIRRSMGAGDLMVIRDHINLMWTNPLIGPVGMGQVRFPDMSAPYDVELGALLHECARARGLRLHDGVYAGLQGPAYETPAEVRMLDRLGADAVGMSTVPEVLVARALGMRVAAVSCITNPAAGMSPGKVDHADVLRATRHAAARFEQLVIDFVAALPRLGQGGADRVGSSPPVPSIVQQDQVSGHENGSGV